MNKSYDQYTQNTKIDTLQNEKKITIPHKTEITPIESNKIISIQSYAVNLDESKEGRVSRAERMRRNQKSFTNSEPLNKIAAETKDRNLEESIKTPESKPLFEIRPPTSAYSGRIDFLRKSDSSGSSIAAQQTYTIFKSPKHRNENIKENNKEISTVNKDNLEVATEQKKYSELIEDTTFQSPLIKEEKLSTENKNEEDTVSKDSETKVISSKSNEKSEQHNESKNNEVPLTFQKKLQKIDSQRKFEEKEPKSKNEDSITPTNEEPREIGNLRQGAKKIIPFSEFIRDKEKSRIPGISKTNTSENKCSPQKVSQQNLKKSKE